MKIKKKNKDKNKETFLRWDNMARFMPTIARERLRNKVMNKVRGDKKTRLTLDDLMGIPRSRLRKTLRALRMLINKNALLINNRFGMIMGGDHYEADLTLFDYGKKQRMEMYFKLIFSLPMESKDSMMSSINWWNGVTKEEHIKLFTDHMFPNKMNTKEKWVELATREAQVMHADRFSEDIYPRQDLDFRKGGYLAMSGKNKKGVATVKKATTDDIECLLTTGEFVFHKEAVRALGAGSNRRGAIILYSIMDQLYELNKQYDYLPDEIDDYDF